MPYSWPYSCTVLPGVQCQCCAVLAPPVPVAPRSSKRVAALKTGGAYGGLQLRHAAEPIGNRQQETGSRQYIYIINNNDDDDDNDDNESSNTNC